MKVNFFSLNDCVYHLAVLILLFASYSEAQSEAFTGQRFFHLREDLVATYTTPQNGNEGNIRIKSTRAGVAVFNVPVDSNKTDIRDIIIGDIDNDAQDELVILTRLSILVYESVGQSFADQPEYTVDLYGPNRSGDPSVVSPPITWTYYPPAYVSAEDRSGGRIAVGDVDNDGNNEIVVTKTLLYNRDHQTPFKEFYSTADILEWADGTLKVVDTYTQLFGDGSEGIFIVDLDGDGHNELMMAQLHGIVILEHVLDPENYPSDEGGGLYRQWGTVTGRYQPKGWMVLSINNSQDWGQRTFLTTIDGKKVLARAVLMSTSSPADEVGKVRFFHLDPKVMQVFKSGNMKNTSPPEVPYLYAEDIDQPFLPIQLPTDNIKGRIVVRLDGLSAGDIDGDGSIEIIANMRDKTLIYELAK